MWQKNEFFDHSHWKFLKLKNLSKKIELWPFWTSEIWQKLEFCDRSQTQNSYVPRKQYFDSHKLGTVALDHFASPQNMVGHAEHSGQTRTLDHYQFLISSLKNHGLIKERKIKFDFDYQTGNKYVPFVNLEVRKIKDLNFSEK